MHRRRNLTLTTWLGFGALCFTLGSCTDDKGDGGATTDVSSSDSSSSSTGPSASNTGSGSTATTSAGQATSGTGGTGGTTSASSAGTTSAASTSTATTGTATTSTGSTSTAPTSTGSTSTAPTQDVSDSSDEGEPTTSDGSGTGNTEPVEDYDCGDEGDVAVNTETRIMNVDYVGDGKVEHTLNIYKPAGEGPFPVILYYTGLAFSWSDAKSDGNMATEFNAAGFAIVGPNLSGGGSCANCSTYPTQIQELKAVVRFLRANAKKFGLDPTFIGVTGMSSGGWNTVMLATTGDVGEHTIGSTTMDLEGDLGGNTGCSSRVQAAWASCPPTDFSAMDGCGSILNHDDPGSPEGGIVGGRVSENLEINDLANPITFVSKDDPPLYLRHGTADDIVPTCQSELLWDAMQSSGNEKDMDYTPQQGQSHAEFPAGRLDFFQTALENNKQGCLDPESPAFDPLATYCLSGNCCN